MRIVPEHIADARGLVNDSAHDKQQIGQAVKVLKGNGSDGFAPIKRNQFAFGTPANRAG